MEDAGLIQFISKLNHHLIATVVVDPNTSLIPVGEAIAVSVGVHEEPLADTAQVGKAFRAAAMLPRLTE